MKHGKTPFLLWRSDFPSASPSCLSKKACNTASGSSIRTLLYQVHHSLLKGTKAQYKVIFPETLAGTKEWEQEKKAFEKKKQALMESYGLNPDLSLIDAARRLVRHLVQTLNTKMSTSKSLLLVS